MAITTASVERLKSRAEFFNGLSVAFFSIGILTPILAALIFETIPATNYMAACIVFAVCFVMAYSLRVAADEQLIEIDK